jgi:hypothetical protein
VKAPHFVALVRTGARVGHGQLHVRHCPVRAVPEDRYLSDAEWDEIARRIVEAAGIARPVTT